MCIRDSHQSALEKKSALTLNDPQKVQIKGKHATNNQTIIKVVLKIFKAFDLLSSPYSIYLAVLNSFHVLIKTGAKSMAIPTIVIIEVAAAEPNNITSSLTRLS